MSIVIGVLDSLGNTDNIVYVDHESKKLVWIPRDLYSFVLNHRINVAFKLGGHKNFIKSVNRFGFAAKYSLCLTTEACARVLNTLKITVPVDEHMEYYYPTQLFGRIEDGEKIVCFQPPQEVLEGERIHQYLGARFRVDRKKSKALPDFERIHRQKIFVRQLLNEKFDFSRFLTSGCDISHPNAIAELKKVSSEYQGILLQEEVINCEMPKLHVLFRINKFTFFSLLYFKIVSYRIFLLRKFIHRLLGKV